MCGCLSPRVRSQASSPVFFLSCFRCKTFSCERLGSSARRRRRELVRVVLLLQEPIYQILCMIHLPCDESDRIHNGADDGILQQPLKSRGHRLQLVMAPLREQAKHEATNRQNKRTSN